MNQKLLSQNTRATYLRADKIRYLNQKFRGRILSPTQTGPQLLLKKSNHVYCQATPGFAALDPDRLDPATESFRTEIIKMHSFITTIHMREFLDDDLEQQERLDTRIARLREELIEIKARKQVLRQTSKNDKDARGKISNEISAVLEFRSKRFPTSTHHGGRHHHPCDTLRI